MNYFTPKNYIYSTYQNIGNWNFFWGTGPKEDAVGFNFSFAFITGKAEYGQYFTDSKTF